MNSQVWSFPLDSSHPAAHGGLRLLIEVSAGTVVRAEPVPGALHRGAEKLFESRDYRSLLTLANRHDWLGSLGSECGLADLVEQMLGLRIPPRASWLRMLLQEATRMVHHLLWLGATVRELGDAQAAGAADSVRRRLQDVLETYTGFRVHHMIVQPGGVRADCPADWPEQLVHAGQPCPEVAQSLCQILADSVPPGLATVSEATARQFSTSGPLARASGIHRDARWNTPDTAYSYLREKGVLSMVMGNVGDAFARFDILARQIAVSAQCLHAGAIAMSSLEDSAVNSPLPRNIRVPEGDGYAESENPAGINGWYLESRGGPTPYRVFLRTASTNNAQAFAAALPGTRLDDLPLAVMSALLLAGDIDK